MKIKQHLQQRQERIEDMPSLLFKTADLMKEGYQLAESLTMLLPYYTKFADKWQMIIQRSIGEGHGAPEIFKRLKVEDEFLVSIYFAEKHGNLAITLAFISEQMKYKNDMQMRLKKILTYPLFMFFILVSFFVAFRLYFLPNIANLIMTRSNDDLTTIQWSKFLLHMPDYFISLGIMLVCLSIGVIIYIRKKNINLRLQYLIKLPIINTFYKLTLTRQIARNLGNLLITGFSLQQAIHELKSQHFKQDLQYIASILEERIIYGQSLSESVSHMPYFFHKFEMFVEHGEKNGLLGRELILYCDILDEKLKYYVSIVLSFIQPVFFIIIAICIIAAYLSILLPMYKMIDIV